MAVLLPPMSRRRWLWVFLFFWIAALLFVLATGWNVVILQDYYRMLELARTFAMPSPAENPWVSIVLGTLGFLAVLGTMALFFVRLLREMKLTQLQSEFLATISHELKTPIAAMELSSSLLRSGGLAEDEVQGLWDSHQAELKRLREEVEALLEAARWGARLDSKKLQKTSVDLESWIHESLQRWQKLLGPGARIQRSGDPIHARMKLDLKTFNLITDNLIDNARKYSRGQPNVTICTEMLPPRFPLVSRRPRWRMAIRDQGWGFQPDEARKIFSRFHRAKTGSPIAIPGTGLGLYLASSASKNLGISLKAESPGPGKGATFILEGKAH